MAAVGPAPLRVLGSRPWLFVQNKPKRNPETSERRVLGSLSLPVCESEVLGSSPPWLLLWYGKEGEGGALRPSHGLTQSAASTPQGRQVA